MNKKYTFLTAGISGSLILSSIASTPYTKPDGSWITISGKVTKTTPDVFEIDYGKGAISVEMDDYDWYPEGNDILIGDDVIVTGKVDADKGEPRSIEASSVFVKNEKLSFFASADDEEDASKSQKSAITTDYPVFNFYGTVTDVNKDDMLLDTGYQLITVDTSMLSEKAFDKDGNIQLEKNDTVSVTGRITEGYFGSPSLIATSAIEYTN